VCALVAALTCAIAVASMARADELHGTVRLIESVSPSADLEDALVWWIPDAGTRAPAPQTVEINTVRRQFSPRTIAVAPGSTVRFPNGDPIRHNVFSISPGNRFDLGLYGKGAGRAQVFKRPGLARLFCNVHRQMAAWVMVLETPYHARVATDGTFALTGLPSGPGTLHVWHPRAAEWSRALVMPAEAPIAQLTVTYSAVPDHLNKFGQPYPDTPDDGTYR
jgi:plastocyanin